MPEVLLLTADDVAAVFDLPEAIDSQREAFRALGEEQGYLAPRLLVPGADSTAFCYAARVLPEAGAVCKFGSVNPANTTLPVVSATIITLDPVTGQVSAIIDGTSVTTLRTSAASAVAVDCLARPDSSVLAVLGAGVQGEAHVRAIARVRDLREVRLQSRDGERCASLASGLAAELGIEVRAVPSAREAVTGAGIVAACTTSSSPVVEGAWLDPGCTVLSIGSFAPDRSEVSDSVLGRAVAVVVDDVDAAMDTAGPIVAGLAAGRLRRDDLVPLGRVVAGVDVARRTDDDIVFFNSVGLGIQDAAAAARITTLARTSGRGRIVGFS